MTRDQAIDRIKKCLVMSLRWLTAIPMRILLLAPCVLLTHLFWALGRLFEALGDGAEEARRILRPITVMPFVLDWRSQIEELEDKERLRLLRRLERDNT